HVVGADLAEVLDRDDVRVDDARGEPRLVEKVRHRALVACEVRVHDLERDQLLEAGLSLGACKVDVGHPARAETAHDLPAPDPGRRRISQPPSGAPARGSGDAPAASPAPTTETAAVDFVPRGSLGAVATGRRIIATTSSSKPTPAPTPPPIASGNGMPPRPAG